VLSQRGLQTHFTNLLPKFRADWAGGCNETSDKAYDITRRHTLDDNRAKYRA